MIFYKPGFIFLLMRPKIVVFGQLLVKVFRMEFQPMEYMEKSIYGLM
jgi:hypothetical protein